MIINTIVTMLSAAPSPQPTGDDVFGWLLESVKWIVEQFQAHNYAPAVAMLVMVVTFLFSKLLASKLPRAAMPWVSAGIGVLIAMATKVLGMAMGASTTDLLSTLVQGFVAGMTASGMWSMLGKKLLGSSDPATADPAAPPEPPPAP